MSGIIRIGVFHLRQYHHPLYYTLKFPTMVMPQVLIDEHMKYEQPLELVKQVRWTYILHYTTYLGEFTETQNDGKFIYLRDFNMPLK